MATRRRSRFSTLTNSISDIEQRLRYVEKRPSYSRLARQVVRRPNIQPKSVATDQLANKSVTNSILDTNSVTGDKIAPRTIQSENIGIGQITNGNVGGGEIDGRTLADNAVESRHIKDGEVKEADIGASAVTTAKINGLAVTTDKINDLAVTTGKINGSAVTTEKINGSAVTTEKINNLAVTNEKLANDSVGTGKIRDLNVTRGKIANDAIDTSKLNNNAVTTAKIADLQITNAKIAGGTIGEGKLAFTPVQTVSAGDGLAGGGSAKSVTLRVDNTVSRTTHTHNQYAASNHRHDNLYPSNTHTHFVSGGSGVGGNPSHVHNIFITSGAPSTLRVKEEISSYEFDTSKLLKLDLKKFKYLRGAKPRDMNRDWFFGYIAEELIEQGFEEVVGYDETGLPNAINYSLIGVMSLELIKKHEEKIEQLEKDIKRLSERFSD